MESGVAEANGPARVGVSARAVHVEGFVQMERRVGVGPDTEPDLDQLAE